MISAARAVLDAAGPLGDTSPPRHEHRPRRRDRRADAGDPRRGRGGAPPARAARRRSTTNTRAVARVALGDRVDVLEAPRRRRPSSAPARSGPDLVILDWAGAGAAGSPSLRDDALTRDAKVLLLVDYGQGASREVAAAGADERLAAPFSPLQLQVKLRTLLGAEVIGG